MKVMVFIISFPLAVMGLTASANMLIATATIVLGVGFLLADISKIREGRVPALTFFSLAAVLSGIGDAVVSHRVASGYLEALQYGKVDFYSSAIFLSYVGAVLPHLGAHGARELCKKRRKRVLPMVEYSIYNPLFYRRLMICLAIVVLVLQEFGSLEFAGLLANIFDYFPIMAIFLLARDGYSRRVRTSTIWAVLLAIYISVDAALNAYLRGEIIFPWMMLCIGAFMGQPKADIMVSPPFLAAYGMLAIFLVFFFVMGEVRTEKVYGMDRIERLLEVKEDEREAESVGIQKSPFQRNANINKVSAIFDLVNRNGFYKGKSIAYMKYAFIPRIIWPDKPIIQQGGWFAKEIKMGREVGGGRHSNAINMTIPGELYLNFGWPGVVAGCIGVGFLIMLIWESTGFWTQPFNLTGSMLAFMLIKRCYEFLGPDLQSIVGYIAGYLSLLGLSYLARSLFPQAPRVSSSHVTGWKGRGRWSRMARTP